MSEEYSITIHDALELWDCIATLKIADVEVSLLTLFQRDTIRKKYDFAVKGRNRGHIYADYNDICVITLKDYSADIGIFVKRQARIEAFIALHKSMTNIANVLAKARLAWELEQKGIEASLEITQIIPDISGGDEE